MDDEDIDPIYEHTFLWFIDNYSYCWHERGDILCSPQFTAFELYETAWRLRLYPMGFPEHNGGSLSLCLDRSEKDNGPRDPDIKFVLSILAVDGSTICSSEHKMSFKQGEGTGASQLIDNMLLYRMIDFLSQDTLTICCKMWMGEEKTSKYTRFGKSSARTVIGIQKISFLHRVKNFTKLKSKQKSTIPIRSPSIEEGNLSFGKDFNNEGKLFMEISPFGEKCRLFKQKVFLLGGSGNIIECGECDSRFDAVRKEIQKLPLSLTRQSILNNKSEYLTENDLYLLCECTFSPGVKSEKIEEIQYCLPKVALNFNCYANKAVEKLSACTSVSEDMQTIYVNQCMTDIKLNTNTKSFPAHKIVLCARSSVFQAMLTNDMREKNTDCIRIDDLEDGTVQQLLLFLYSDKIENLQWESAIKLYYAGDKYAIEKLKVMCSSFLVSKLKTSNASELLVLADTHNDFNLKLVVEEFIFKHEKQVFGSDEWVKLIEINPVLVSKTMCLKYSREKEGPDNYARKRRISEDRSEIVKQMKQYAQ